MTLPEELGLRVCPHSLEREFLPGKTDLPMF